ncbi:MAG: NAD(P)-dependent oxidoreductase [Deltaproteobacteria bacterium]|nr:NAD(P)-dependent oxidoreductase [Deltaproteobacteria bacterium]
MILITGGLGFLGCNLAKILSDAGEEVLLTANRNTEVPQLIAPSLGKSLTVTPLSITSLENIVRALRDYGVTAIVHAAARSEKGNTSLYQAMDVNVTGTINVLEAAWRAGIGRVLFISSEAVYQGTKQSEPFKEEEKLFITSDRFVPGTKKAGEILCLMYSQEHSMEAISIRLTRVYGPLYKGIRNLPGHMLEKAAKGIPIDLGNYDPHEAHDFIYAKDAARALAILLKAPELRHRIYNVGVGKLTRIGEFADAIRELLPEVEVHLGDAPGPLTSTKTPMDINACVDISRLCEETGFAPEYDPVRAVEHYVEWAKTGNYK